jgi:hypothetical protein
MTVYSLHSLLDYECLLFYCDEWRAKNLLGLNWTELTSRRAEYKSPLRTVREFICYYLCFSVAMKRA